MRLTWVSNAPWARTGYGTQTEQVVRRLQAAGHEVAVAANYGLAGTPFDKEGLLVLPQGRDAYSSDIMYAHHIKWTQGQPSWLVTLYDVWPYHDAALRNPIPSGINIASWVPIDHLGVPPKVAAWCSEHYTIAMSRHGQEALALEGIDARYVPHAIDTSVFRPTPTLPDGRPTREAMGVPDDAFLVMVNAANKGNVPPRKAWGEMLDAFSTFALRHKDAVLFLHTDIQGQGGVDIPTTLKMVGLSPDRVRFTDQYAYLAGLIDQDVLAAYYSAADVLLATSMGEGFGIPVIEAQACGVPVIVTDFSAQPELVGAGWKVPWQRSLDVTQAEWFAMPMVAGIVDALEQSYAERGSAENAQGAIVKAAEYDADRVFDRYWRPVLAELEALLTPPKNLALRKKKGKK